MTGRARIGCSSWTSEAWWGRVYPDGLADGERLRWYAQRWETVEVDSSYYRAPTPYLLRRWASVTPDGFVFALKFPRDLLDPKKGIDREGIAGFFGSLQALGTKLGPVLLQFPPWFKPGRTAAFLEGVLAEIPTSRHVAVELRDAGWFRGATFSELRRLLGARQVALAWSYLSYVDVPAELTGDFVYLRFIGDHTSIPAERHGELRADRTEETARWAERFQRALQENVQEGFAFFNNHFAGFAPESVNLFRRLLGLEPIAYRPPAAGAPQAHRPGVQQRLE